jgi:hypothetical protein
MSESGKQNGKNEYGKHISQKYGKFPINLGYLIKKMGNTLIIIL